MNTCLYDLVSPGKLPVISPGISPGKLPVRRGNSPLLRKILIESNPYPEIMLYIYIYIHTHMHIYIYIHIHICIYRERHKVIDLCIYC